MKQRYASLLLALGGLLLQRPAAAQISLTSVLPQTENFNSLTGKTAFVSNTTIKGVYVEYAGYTSVPCVPNDGSNQDAAFYHFGESGSNDRALGGVASFATNGTGYVAMRFQNNTGAVIKNLGVSFAIEQWYNSGRQDKAQVSFDYRTSSTAITSVGAGTSWVNVPELNVDAPSTATVIDNKNGNSAANRRTRTYTIQNLNLAKGAEVMLRWRYELNNATNGNGLSVDDVTVTPETNVYYYRGAGEVSDKANWSSSPGGTADLNNFTTAGRTYYILSNVTDDRISGNWRVTGAGSKVVIGDGVNPAYLLVGGTKGGGITATLDVLDNATLEIQRGQGQLPTLGRIANKSTVKYVRDGNATDLTSTTYGNLIVDGSSPKALTGSTIINGDLTLSGSSVVVLGDYDLTVIRGGKINGGTSTAFVRTDGTGMLKQTVLADGVVVPFPVGTGALYTPAYLSQTAARSEDVFSVQVKNSLFDKYTGRAGVGAALSNRNVHRTWFVEEEVAGSSNVTLQLQWPATVQTADFVPTAARLEHYNTTANTWDATPVVGATTPDGGATYSVIRAGITSFSPFGVSASPGGPLPVQLTAFGAQWQAGRVVCDWQTARELHNDHFVVERSATGQDFASVGQVAGLGTSNTGRHYRLLDAAPLPGLSYYRLRQVDTDGTTSFSKVVTVLVGPAGATPYLTPNPGTDRFQLVAPAPWRAAEVRNALGALVLTVPTTGLIDLTGQPAGLYLVQVQTAGGFATLRLVKN